MVKLRELKNRQVNDFSPPKLFLDASLVIAALFSHKSDSPACGLFNLGENRLLIYKSDDALRKPNGVLQGLLDEDYEIIKFILAENFEMANIVTAAAKRVCEKLLLYDTRHLLSTPRLVRRILNRL
ncbi:hypothetical protein CCAX7_49520 [Capsulimonas corticalis]|uniref:Uncharacterized protein n=2 Tax=Capsulimonas corticalis TaxID=2219043 RepID=A0A402CPX2_9BACT|nr:hypothetical protein CCAX7_49520 [Capsulimonas corticalis]